MFCCELSKRLIHGEYYIKSLEYFWKNLSSMLSDTPQNNIAFENYCKKLMAVIH